MSKEYICIGGPLDGESRAVLYGTSFRVIVHQDFIGFPSDYKEPRSLDTTFVTYHRISLSIPPYDYPVWIPENQSLSQTFRKLLEHYKIRSKM